MVTRLVGGLTPADGGDPRTFPAIWNVTADEIEAVQSNLGAVESTVTALGGTVTVQAAITEANSTAIAGLDSLVTAQGSAISVIEAWNLDDLNDVTIGTAVADGNVLAYSTAVSGWVNAVASAGGGKILQVVNASATTTVTISTTSTFTATNLSASITPSSTDNKILVIVEHQLSTPSADTSSSGQVRIKRGATVLETWSNAFEYSSLSNIRMTKNHAVTILDSPSTTSAITYSTEAARVSGPNFVVNQSGNASKITLMEVAD